MDHAKIKPLLYGSYLNQASIFQLPLQSMAAQRAALNQARGVNPRLVLSQPLIQQQPTVVYPVQPQFPNTILFGQGPAGAPTQQNLIRFDPRQPFR